MPPLDFDRFPALKGHSMVARSLRHAIGEHAPRWMALLLDGPPGAGQLDAARALHALGKRAARPFAHLAATAHPAGRLAARLLEAARQAADGTLFVEDAHLMPPPAQRALEALAVEGALGDGTRSRARIVIGAEARRLIPVLREALRDAIPMPSLSHRREDIGAIAGAMLRRIGAAGGKPLRLDAEGIAALATLPPPDLPTLAARLLAAAPHAIDGVVPARALTRRG